MYLVRQVWLWLRLKFSVSPRVKVGKDFTFGERTRIWAPNSLSIGDNASFGSDCIIEVDGVIGNDVLVASRVGIVGRVDHAFRTVGIPVWEAPWVGSESGKELSKPIEIGSDVWIGYGATILSGIRVGNFAVIAAGAVVVTDIEENEIVAGNPAKSVGKRFSDDELSAHKSLLGFGQ